MRKFLSMIKKYFPLFLLILFVFTNSFGQHKKLKKLENQIKTLNDNMQYEKSIALLNEIINNPDASHYDKYYAYLLESFTHKRLFNYTKTLHKLDLALAEGLQSEQKEEAQNTITAEKCFVYFDTQDYPKAEVLINHLRKLQFKHISIPAKSWIIMQDGYIKMLNKDYVKSEQLLNEAIALVKVNSPENLPNK